MTICKTYIREGGRYECIFCEREFASYSALARHQFHNVHRCMTLDTPAEPLPMAEVPFEGERLAVPTEATTVEASPEHRDAAGRLRMRGKLVGYRKWALGRVDGAYRLFPIWRGGDAPYSRGVMTAVCDANPIGPVHPAPEASCQCGFFALWHLRDAAHQPGIALDRSLISGRITGLGVVIPGTRGWRSQFAMVDEIHSPRCVEPGCDEPSTRGVVRASWLRQLTPAGLTYPPVQSSRHMTYRETGDFQSRHLASPYVGWFCRAHGATEYMDVSWKSTCNFPIAVHHLCKRPARMALKGVPYTWCFEHAPLILETAEVMRDLRSYYDVAHEVAA